MKLTSPCGAEDKNAWSCTATPPYVPIALCLIKHPDNFTNLSIARLAHPTLSRDSVNIDGVWIGDWGYWTLLQLVTTLYKSVTHRLMFSVTLLGNGFNANFQLQLSVLDWPAPLSCSALPNCRLSTHSLTPTA
jgi:hypothetical protein